MGIPVMILGESGSGKSTSLRNFSPDEVVIYNVAGKPLPFRNNSKMKKADNPTYGQIFKNLMAKNIDGNYVFITQSDGTNTVKAPMEMFEKSEMENDLKKVDNIIREYYEIKK